MVFTYPSNTRMTAQNVNTLMANRRAAELQQNDLLKYTKQNITQSVYNNGQINVQHKIRANHRAQIAAEKMLDERMIEKEKEHAQNERSKEQNQLLARALEDKRRATEKREREIQRICENSEELRELEAMLKTAYMNKERATQQTEKLALNQMESVRERAMDEQMEYDRQMSLCEMQNQEMQRRQKALESKYQLQNQMVERMKLAEEAKLQAEIDRRNVEEIMQKIEMEDQREMGEKIKTIEHTRQLIDECKRQRQDAIAEERRLAMEEDEKIRAFSLQRTQREATIKAMNEEKKRREEEQFLMVEAEIKRKQMEEEELAQLRADLWEEELHAARIKKENEKMAKQAKDRSEMMKMNATQREEKLKQLKEQEEIERKYNEQVLRKFKEDERLEKLVKEEKAIQKLAYQSAIERQNLEKQQFYMQELHHEQQELQKTKEEEEFNKRVIEEAKRRLLEEHAAVLKGYLPRGVYREKGNF